MDNSRKIEYVFTASVQGLERGVKQVENLIDQAKSKASEFGEALSEGAYQAIGSINDLDGKTQALLASVTALEVAFAKSSLDTFAQYEDAMYGMATTVGNVGGTIEEAMEGIRASTANGLLSETDAARAINNLTSYGYSVQEATTLIQELTNVSMAHRNETKSVSEQVEALTEGMKRGSSQMLKTNGLMESASVAYAVYAESIGKTANELSDAERRQALFNSVVEQGEASASVASAYQESYSAATQRLSNAMSDLKAAFGQALAPLATWLANAASWIAQNRQLVAGLVTFVGVLIGAGGVAVALAKIIPVLNSTIVLFNGLQISTKGVVLGLASVAATLAVIGASSAAIKSSMADVTQQTQTSGAAAEDAADGFNNLGASIGGVGGSVRDVSKDLEKLRRQYLDELKQIENRHKETIDKLTKQIQDANVDYRRAIDERNAEFAVSQAKEEKKHQEKVDDIMAQIAFLQRYNNDYNKQKLANLEFALAKENALYQKQTEAAKAELDLQNENDRVAYEEKRAALQSELEEELAFMNRHREDLKAVRDWILEDEIDALKRRYLEQQKSYTEQAAGAAAGGYDVGSNYLNGVSKGVNEKAGEVKKVYTTLADEVGWSWDQMIMGWVSKGINWIIQAIKDVSNWFSNIGTKISNLGESIGRGIDEYFTGLGDRLRNSGWIFKMAGDIGKAVLGFAGGGYTGRGPYNEVAGVVHKGEYVLPQDMVDQNTGTPKAMGNVYNITISGTFATSAAERRKVADQIVAAINQNNKSRLEASWQ